MSYKEVVKDLKNNCLGNLYLFYGTEHYLLENTMTMIQEKIINKTFDTLNYQEMDGKETTVGDIINACETLPFMGEKRMIIVKDLECFFSKRKNISEEDEEKLILYFENIPSTTHLFFIATKDIDKRKKIVRSIKKKGKMVEFNKLSEKEVYRWIHKVFEKFHKKIGDKEIAFLLDITGYLDKNSSKNLKDLENEIIKISNYAEDQSVITSKDIDLLTAKSIDNNIFHLVECIGEKNASQALVLLNDMLLGGEAELKILYMITREFRFLYQIKLLEKQGYTPMAIAPKLGIQQFLVRKYLKQTQHFDTDILKKGLEQCLYTDESIKTGKIAPRLAIELLISRFAG